MQTRVEVTKHYVTKYAKAAKKVKGHILDTVVELTGWNRDHARQQLRRRLDQPKGRATATVAVIDRRKTKARKYSYDATKVLQHVWSISGGLSGKYLAASMADWLDGPETHGRLVFGQGRYSRQVRAELLAMSAATIDRYLKPARDKDPLRGRAATKPGTLLRDSVAMCQAGDEVGDEPGFFDVDTVAHCGPTLVGEFARSVNFTDMRTGWTDTTAIRNNAATYIVGACTDFVAAIPYLVTGMDFDNGSELMNYDLLDWAAEHKVFFTRDRPYQENDQATVESKNNHAVRKYGFYYRYDTAEELGLLQHLWPLVNDRRNFFTPAKKPTGWSTDAVGRRKRLYDHPITPYQRLLDSGILSPAQQQELTQYKASLDPAAIAIDIDHIQHQLVKLATAKTRNLQRELDTANTPPDPAGIKIHRQAS
ncbi:integrase [Auritidibacter ignavus]|uniref:integrase n=1 Tax=Auritidibacter ignavus TaxID=678932 RepID=UPI00244901E3|nr:integrase [Auritidibacter ignavus]WGH89962.1 integrase [Auritidibacter ignavus]